MENNCPDRKYKTKKPQVCVYCKDGTKQKYIVTSKKKANSASKKFLKNHGGPVSKIVPIPKGHRMSKGMDGTLYFDENNKY